MSYDFIHKFCDAMYTSSEGSKGSKAHCFYVKLLTERNIIGILISAVFSISSRSIILGLPPHFKSRLILKVTQCPGITTAAHALREGGMRAYRNPPDLLTYKHRKSRFKTTKVGARSGDWDCLK